MRIGLFEGPGAGRAIRPGVVTDDGIVDVSSATAQDVVHLRREAQARSEPEPEGGWQNWVPEDWEGRSTHG
jgi:hypothetical protein